MEHILAGLSDAFTLINILAVAGGCALGILVGAIPGLNGPMAIAIAVPMTFFMQPLAAIAMLVGVMKGGTFGGATPAILLNTPGTPDATATAIDGYPLAQKGQPIKALKMSLFSATFGDVFSDLVLFLVAAPLAAVALLLGPVEISALLLLSFSILAGLGGKSLPKGLMSASLGLLLSTVGLDPGTGLPRLTFGLPQLDDGIPLAALGIGLLALGEVIRQIELSRSASGPAREIKIDKLDKSGANKLSWREFSGCLRTLLRSSVIGCCIGALPGLGSTLAAFLGYGAARRASKEPESFGTGKLEGVAACEAANSAVQASALIPLLALGIPGNIAAAMLIGAFIIHGVTPGPLIFQNHATLVYGLFSTMIMADFLVPLIGLALLPVFVRVIKVSSNVTYPVVILLCLSGAYMAGDGMFSVGLTVAFGILGYLMRRLEISFVTFVIGFVLGPMFERSLTQAVVITNGDPLQLIHHPIALVILALALIVIVRMTLGSGKSTTSGSKALANDTKAE